jgi:plasmid stabilization system protein ParE
MVKFKVEWSIEARLDLLDILDFYIVRNKSAAYSKKLNSKINNSIKLISKNPLIGLQSEIESVRALITGDYQIIYEILDKSISISMIWDCRRDPGDKIIDSRIKKVNN